MRLSLTSLTAVLILAATQTLAAADFMDWVPARREAPSDTAYGFLAFPIYSHLPGIGSTYGGGVLARNILGTRTNLLAAGTFGDLTVLTLALTEIHLIKDHLIFGSYIYDAQVPYPTYDRGSQAFKDGYFYNTIQTYGGATTLEFHTLERRIQILAQVGSGRLAERVRERGGLRFTNVDRSEFQGFSHMLRARLDLTDQILDPRRGVRLDLLHSESDYFDGNHSRSYTLSAYGSGYVPVGTASTVVFNFARASAHVYDTNTKSEAQLKQDIGLNCAGYSDLNERSSCQQTEARRVRERLDENRYGTVPTLGGSNQLRGFPSGRARGAESIFYGTEWRWNLSDESTPFDHTFIRGVRSTIQAAFFYEAGAASDPPQSVLDVAPLQTFGIGFRYGFSGTLVRADLGFSAEGPQFTFFFGYPWEPSVF